MSASSIRGRATAGASAKKRILRPCAQRSIPRAMLCWLIPRLRRPSAGIFGQDAFYMQLPGSGGDMSAGDLIAGVMARTAELPGDRFRSAARELSAFLMPAADGASDRVPGDIDEGCDLMLFYGPRRERTDRDPGGHSNSSVRRSPAVRGRETCPGICPARCRLPWLAIGRGGRPAVPVAARVPSQGWRVERSDASAGTVLSGRSGISRLACRQPRVAGAAARSAVRSHRQVLPIGSWAEGNRALGSIRGWLAQGLDGFADCPVLTAAALDDAREVFENRENIRYRRLAHVVGRLARALARDGRFAAHDRVVDVAIALEGMYDLPRQGVTNALEARVAGFLGIDEKSRDRIGKNARAFYDARSAIVHNRSAEATPFTNGAAFVTGFDLARMSLFKMLREGVPKDWDRLAVAGD